ncbi:MAG: gliding motility-associated C-terminal domain-containing protein [Bacteroidales bacterium]|nr:gliding motility-associated C-terminal domain-containing protein [Bacteroidales bacterium]
MYKVKFVFIGLLLFCRVLVFATHERAGEITYKHISGTTYEFTLLTYTYSVSLADRPELELNWGDGTTTLVPRTSKTYLGNDINRNLYVAQHTFPASGSYTVSVEDENRNQGIINIPNSVNIPFYVETVITINSFLKPNNSPVLQNPPIDVGCVGEIFYHNPVAIDPDGDSLSFSLVDCRGFNGTTIPGYSLPIAGNSISIDPKTGDFVWDYPMMQGEYNIAILIEEYRNGIKISSIIRDMQIAITACDNKPPEIYTITDTCIEAGTLLSFAVNATDTNTQIVTLSGMGEPLSLAHFPAVFDTAYGYGTASNNFVWQTDCGHTRKQPYYVVFKAMDNGVPVHLIKQQTVSISIVCPAPVNVQATAFENAIALSWNHTPCYQYAQKYLIYRRKGSSGFVPDHCQTGVPDYTGYQLIASVPIGQTSFIDDNNHTGLSQATEYCYLITAQLADKSESYASNEACAIVPQTKPILTKISIVKTDTDSGETDIAWLKPKDIDTSQYQGPYRFELYASLNDTNHFVLVDSFPDGLYNYTHRQQNTKENIFYYRVKMFDYTHEKTLMGESENSSSVFLKATAYNTAILLEWKENVSWDNYQYTVYRYNEQTQNFDSIDCVSENYHMDSGLQNEQQYTYFVQSWGNYADTNIIRPLLNLSQTITITPFDGEPPCCPVLSGETDCKSIELHWSIDTCQANDIARFYIHYKPDYNSDFTIYDSVSAETNKYQLSNLVSVIGCWMVTAIDTNGNECDSCNITCFGNDLCDNYKLPNIFTPNGDGINDVFTPYDFDFVESANITIYNRWGNIVFETNDPNINWDGTSKQTQKPCSDGVYYYVCIVNEYTLKGIASRTITGSITLAR